MRVLCIADSGWFEIKKRKWYLGGGTKEVDCDGPSYGDTCTVLSEYWEAGCLYYNLMEWPGNDAMDGYEADCFVPIEDFERENEQIEINVTTFTN